MLTVFLAWLMACGTPAPPVSPVEGNTAPSISAMEISGAAFSLNQHRGTPVVLVFWASWCGPCRQETPEVAELVAHYGDRVSVVGVNAGESPAVAARAAQSWSISWPVVVDPDARIQQDYRVDAIPLVVMVDKVGVIRYRGLGMPHNATEILDGLL